LPHKQRVSYEEQSEVPCCLSLESRLRVEVEYVAEGNMKPITDEVIEEATRRIVSELDPEEIILFGSYAWGKPDKYSDLDGYQLNTGHFAASGF